LHGYLARNIVEQLTDEERELLLVTSVLQSVTAERAQALGISVAAARLSAIRRRHLPASWQSDPLTMRCHPQFREYLLERFTQTGGDRVSEAWRALGHLLREEGYAEEAVEAFLEAGDRAAGADVADSIIVSIVQRLDFDVAHRWLAAFAAAPGPARAGFVTAELLMGMWSSEDMVRGADIADQLLATGERDGLVRSSSLLGALLASCYGAVGRHDDARAVLDASGPSPETAAVRYGMTVRDDEPPAEELPVPELTGGPLDIVIVRANYHRGLLARVAEQPPIPHDYAVEPWRVSAIAALGQTARALECYERASDAGAMWRAGAELMIDLGREQEARELIEFGRRSPSGTADIALLHRANVLEAQLALRCRGDTATARLALARVLNDRVASKLAFMREHAETWLGLALLIDGDEAEAATMLRRTVAGMNRCGRRLLLPAAAVYLAEAEWRAGDEEAADRAADTALAAAEFQGSNHILLGALHDFPAVAWRRAEAEPTADSPWHRFARLLRSPSPGGLSELPAATPQTVEVVEFGAAELIVDGQPTRPRLTKGHTLLALLATKPGCETLRRGAVEELFESGTDASTVAYLRLAVRSARDTLPDGIDLTLDRQVVRCTPPSALSSESVRFETMLASARSLTGADRLEAFSGALALHGRGPYLEREASPWAQERRRQLDDLAEDALIQASETAYELGEYAEAERLVRQCLGLNRYRESAWRLLMRIAAATCDQDAVIAAYRECERAIGEMGTRPCTVTESLLTQLRV
jgi:DNA-binding SARP family transcriptional activator